MRTLFNLPAVRRSLVVLLAVLYLLPLVMVKGAVDMFLKIEGVDGESKDSDHKDWIEVTSFEHGVTKPASGTGSGRTSGVTSFQELKVAKWIDKSSPILMRSVCDGRVFPKVELDVKREGLSDPTHVTYMTYTLNDCLVTSSHLSQSPGAVAPTEAITLNFTAIGFSYTELDGAGALVFSTNVTCTVE